MVKHCLLYLFFLPSLLFSAEFTANVSRNLVTLGESFTLNLTLTDASAKESPSLSSLKKAFTIHGQRQSSNTLITNGKMSFSINWQLTLIPHKKGEVTIPSITVETAEGALATEPISLRVLERGQTSGSDATEESGMTLTTEISAVEPYKNQPITYTVKLISKHPLANVSVQKISLEEALVDMPEEPEVKEKIFEGVKVKVIEMHYLITPLKSGPLTIPPVVIQGVIPEKKQARTHSFFNDPFSMMRSFNNFQPFALSTDEVILEVQPPLPTINPWLPAQSLTIQEKWEESQQLRVGEPFTRNFLIEAKGVRGNQLPSLTAQQVDGKDIKVYADKPQINEHLNNGVVTSFRHEQYTLIPQQPGSLMLPEITIQWWDVAKKAPAYATVPSRHLEVLPSLTTNEKLPMTVAPNATSELPILVKETPSILYILIASLGILLLFALFWGISLRKKLVQLKEAPVKSQQKKIKNPLPIHLKELKEISTPKQLQTFLQLYAHRQWKTSTNAHLKIVFDAVRKHSPTHLHSEIGSIETLLEDALYWDKESDLNALIQRLASLLQQTRSKTASSGKNREELPNLNPS